MPNFHPLLKAYIRVVDSKFRANIAPTEEKFYCEFVRISAIISVSFGGDLRGFSGQISQNFGAYAACSSGELGGNLGEFSPEFLAISGRFRVGKLAHFRVQAARFLCGDWAVFGVGDRIKLGALQMRFLSHLRR